MTHHVTSRSKKIFFSKILKTGIPENRQVLSCFKSKFLCIHGAGGGIEMRKKVFLLVFFLRNMFINHFFNGFLFWPFLKMRHEKFNLLIVKLSSFAISFYFLFTPVFSHYLENFNSIRFSMDEMSCYVKIVNNSRKSEINRVLQHALDPLL